MLLLENTVINNLKINNLKIKIEKITSIFLSIKEYIFIKNSKEKHKIPN